MEAALFESCAYITEDKKFISVDSMLCDIERWDAAMLISRDEVPPCQTNQLQIDFKAESVVVFVPPKKATNDSLGICKGTKAEAKELKYGAVSPSTRPLSTESFMLRTGSSTGA